MKKLLFSIFAMLLLSSVQAANFHCEDEEKIWKIDFNLEESIITNLNFYKNDVLHRSFPRVEGNRVRIFKREYFEFDLMSPRYFDFDRRRGATSFEAVFFLKRHPFAFDTTVYCKQEQE